MKFNYPLEIYDTLISEILNSRKKPTTKIIDFINSLTLESLCIHTISFKRTTNKIQYKIESSLHNFHPHTPIPKESKSNLLEEFKFLLSQIEQELNIQELGKKYYWNNENKITQVHIVTSIKIEEIEKEQLYFLYCNIILKLKLETIQKRIKETISGLYSIEQIETYIHKKQFALESLATKLVKKINPINAIDLYQYSTTYTDKDCLKIIYSYVEKTICFLEKEYFKYLDKDSQAPIKTIINTKTEIELKYNELKLETNSSAREVIEIVLQGFSKIMELDLQQKITYNEIVYASELIPMLYSQIKYKQKTKKCLKEIILEFNFNSLDFFDYYTNEINKDLERQETDLDKFKILYKYLKNTNQKQLYANNKWNTKLPSAKKQISGWLEEEIQYLNQKRMLESYATTNPINIETKTKFQTDLSVPQLSYFFGLLIQTGIIQPPTQRAIFKFIADHFKTKMTNSISVDSLNSKFYNVETTTKNAIREKIIELLNLSKL